jgi:hypothetical protein
MANEINLSLQVNVANLGYTAAWSETDSYTQTAIGAVGGVQTVLTTMTILDLGSVTTLGYCIFKNLDLVNAVDWGVNSSGFVACGTLNAGEIAIFRFKAGVIPALKAATATTEVQYLLLQN